MAILITGGTGFIGSHLAEQLKRKGNKVILFTGDISKEKNTRSFSADEKIDAIVHLAAVISHRSKKFIEMANVDGTKNVIEMGHRLGAGRLIFLSSIRVLSKSSDPYISSKRMAEEEVLKSGLPYIILRPSMVYGPGDNKNIGLLIKLAKIMPIMPVLNFRLQPVFVEDLIKVVMACLDLPANKILNIVGPEIIGFEAVLNNLTALGYKLWKINAPAFFSSIIRIISVLPFFPVKSWQIETLLNDEVYNGDDWQKMLDIKATLFREGLKLTAI